MKFAQPCSQVLNENSSCSMWPKNEEL